jgi:Domain of unknown function (DUF4105)
VRPARAAALALAGLGVTAPLAGQGPALPADTTPVALIITVGPGPLLWERFGHNMIWLHDPARGADTAYNWGIFDWGEKNFLLNFIRGRMRYRMDGWNAERTLRFYEQSGRSVMVQTLGLTPAEAAALRDYIAWNARAENKYYNYDYYLDNCSTRVRDALDRALNGRLATILRAKPAASTFRSSTARLMAHNPALDLGLMFLLGRGTDRPITAWDESFIPMDLARHLRGIAIRGDDGRPRPLVIHQEVLASGDRFPERREPPRWIPEYLLVGGVLGSLLAWAGLRAGRSRSRWLFVTLGGGWALVAALAGLVLTFLWTATDHTIAASNENILQANLLSVGLFGAMVAWAWGRESAGRAARGLAAAIAALSVLGFLLQVLPGFYQVNGDVLAFFVPANLGMAAGARLSAERTPAPR